MGEIFSGIFYVYTSTKGERQLVPIQDENSPQENEIESCLDYISIIEVCRKAHKEIISKKNNIIKYIEKKTRYFR